ncbi:DUF6328 family protein [Nocardioides currus]|uniref:Sodium:proton antiporter n=1 Tax=Nocardioides currus TaxID=2133958 RepID=A0A2R7YUS9_9ACTN|nr:DUF6328 family protein [Nocardioides currus]PUA80167.1 sodium:proton antiporter [Nocardioides currus]
MNGPDTKNPDPDDPETLDRNWNELLQELRVTQTGVQILTGFLLTVPFSDRFADLDRLQRTSYLVVMAGAVLTTGLVVAPVAFHRILFRQRERRWLVEAGNRCARVGLMLLGLTSSGALFLVFDVVAGTTAGLVALAVSLVFFVVCWLVVPVVSGVSPTSTAGTRR